MKRLFIGLVTLLAGCSSNNNSTVLTIATVNNSDMVRLKSMSSEFTKNHPNISLRWVTLEENVLRQRVTTDIATKGGQFDIVTIGAYEIPIWASRNWLAKLGDLGPAYAADDLIPSVRDAVSVEGVQYASPINGESSITMYRRDLFSAAGLVMPEKPRWDFIVSAAKRLNDPAHGVYGICLRGKAGWGENVALVGAMAHSFGAQFFDENWRPQFDTPEWRRTLETYVDLLRTAGPPGAVANGFNENLSLFAGGKCAIWVDSTVGGPVVSDPKTSTVAGRVGFAFGPDNGLGRSTTWLWTWALAMPASSRKADAARQFIAWATGPSYAALVANKAGWGNVPPGTRRSLYQNPEYRKAAPVAEITLAAIESAQPKQPATRPVPYTGVQFVAIPEFQGIGSDLGQIFAGAVAGSTTPAAALASAQAATERQMHAAGYPK